MRANGGIIIESGKIFRIAQSQEFNIYGYGSKIFEIINLSTNTYEEKLIHNIIPNFDKKSIATHHLNSIDKCTVFDYLYQERID